jgi:hypothetical protein
MPQRQRAGGVAVAAHDGHARLREPELGPDHVDDALGGIAEAEERDVVLAAVGLEGGDHLLGHRVRGRPPQAGSRDDVVHRPEDAIGERGAEPALPQHRERLRGGHLVNEVQADEELRLPGRQPPHRVQIPDLVEKGGHSREG